MIHWRKTRKKISWETRKKISCSNCIQILIIKDNLNKEQAKQTAPQNTLVSFIFQHCSTHFAALTGDTRPLLNAVPMNHEKGVRRRTKCSSLLASLKQNDDGPQERRYLKMFLSVIIFGPYMMTDRNICTRTRTTRSAKDKNALEPPPTKHQIVEQHLFFHKRSTTLP